jgi:hypothetical protein
MSAHFFVKVYVDQEILALIANLVARNDFSTTESSEGKDTNSDTELELPLTEQIIAQRNRPTILNTWTKEANRLSESPCDADELVRTQIYAHLLRDIMGSMSNRLCATVEHDYLYGFLSMTGGLQCPRVLSPDCKHLPRTTGFVKYTDF